MKCAFQYVTHYGSANQEFVDTSIRRYEQKRVLEQASPPPLPSTPPFFTFLPIPYPLPLSTPATQAKRCQVLLSLSPLNEALPGEGGSHVTRLNFKMFGVGVYKCLLLIVGFAVTATIWPREVVSCRDFILCTVATFWATWLVGIYPGRTS